MPWLVPRPVTLPVVVILGLRRAASHSVIPSRIAVTALSPFLVRTVLLPAPAVHRLEAFSIHFSCGGGARVAWPGPVVAPTLGGLTGGKVEGLPLADAPLPAPRVLAALAAALAPGTL